MPTQLVEGVTAPQRFQLLERGAPLNLGGFVEVTLNIVNRLGTAIDTAGMLAVTDAANGIITFTPGSATLLVPANSPYHARFVLTDATGGISYVPDGLRDSWTILAL